MNILLTCAGRRNYLVDYFKEALNGKGKVYAVNSIPEASSMITADGAFIAPPLYEEEYIDFLKRICRKYEIQLLISLFDLELPILAIHKQEFEEIGITMAISDPNVISVCNDKIKTVAFGKELGLKSLFTTTQLEQAQNKITEGELSYPLYIKPRWGMGSIAMQRADNEKELVVLYEKAQRDLYNSYLKHYLNLDSEQPVVIQEMAVGQEYGLDVVNDLKGNYVTTFVKRKLGMRSGETDGAITENVPELLQLGERIGKRLRHLGNLDVDVFWDGNEPVILEMNARFGGGYPFSHLAGANVPKAYVAWASNEAALQRDLTVDYGVKGVKALQLFNYNGINLLR